MRKFIIVLLLALCGCSTNTPVVPVTSQWADFGGNEPIINGNSFAFPTDVNHTAGYFYTKPPQVAPGLLMTLNYDVTGDNPVWAQTPASGGNGQTDINPPTITLFLWRNGDDLACGQNGKPTASYRMWAAKTPLVLGTNQTISVRLDSNLWTNCWGVVDPAGFLAALSDPLGLGFTFGGQWFDGHGIYLSSGTATFTINSFTVQ